MAPVDNVTKCMHALLRIVVKPNAAPRFAIDKSDLLASAQIFNFQLEMTLAVRRAGALAGALS